VCRCVCVETALSHARPGCDTVRPREGGRTPIEPIIIIVVMLRACMGACCSVRVVLLVYGVTCDDRVVDRVVVDGSLTRPIHVIVVC
jgi:hypothetical protein